MLTIAWFKLTRASLTALNPRLQERVHGGLREFRVVFEMKRHTKGANANANPISPLAHLHLGGVLQPPRAVLHRLLCRSRHLHHWKEAPFLFPIGSGGGGSASHGRRLTSCPSTRLTAPATTTRCTSIPCPQRGHSGRVGWRHVVPHWGDARDQPLKGAWLADTNGVQGRHRITHRPILLHRHAFIPLGGGEHHHRTGVVLLHTAKHP